MFKYTIGIIGVGMVGATLAEYLRSPILYDSGRNIGSIEEVNKADFIYICVPTPYIEGVGCDISIVESVVEKITGSKVLIIKSTIIPGTIDMLQEKYPQHKFIFNPEFLAEATAHEDLFFPDKQIVGYTRESHSVAEEIMSQLPKSEYSSIVPARVAEMIKYGDNTWLAIKVAMNNELYDICKAIGFTEEEWVEVTHAMAVGKWAGKAHLKVYHNGKRGYSGKCLTKDMKAFIEFAKQNNIRIPIREEVDKYNDELLIKQGLEVV